MRKGLFSGFFRRSARAEAEAATPVIEAGLVQNEAIEDSAKPSPFCFRFTQKEIKQWGFANSEFPKDSTNIYAEVGDQFQALAGIAPFTDEACAAAMGLGTSLKSTEATASFIDIPKITLDPLLETHAALGQEIIKAFYEKPYYATCIEECDFYRGIVEIARAYKIAPYDKPGFSTETDHIIGLIVEEYPRHLEKRLQILQDKQDSDDPLAILAQLVSGEQNLTP